MIKLLYGEENYLINLNLKKFIKQMESDPIVFDENTDMQQVIMELNTISMFSTFKNIVIRNHPLLKTAKEANEFLEETKDALGDANIIFILDLKTLPKNNLINFIKENGDVSQYKNLTPKEVMPTIKDIVTSNGGTITNGAIIRLASKLPNNLWIIVNEIKKLMIQSNEIDDKMVEIAVGDYFIDEFFALTNAIINLDKRAIISSYKDKVKNGIPAVMIIGQVAGILSLSKSVSTLRNVGMTNKEISNELNIHEFRVKKSLELINKNGEKTIDELIIGLAKLDKDIKTGFINESFGLDYYILKLIK